MNLKDLTAKTKAITDYSPDLQTYNDQLADLLNDAYFNIWTSKRWKFAQVRDFMKVYPDLTFGLTTKNASVLNGTRKVTFSGSIPMLLAESTMGPYGSQSFSTSYGDPGSAYEGQIFQAAGREYNIIKVVSDSEIHLDEQYRGVTNGDNTDWVIKKRFYDLPDDCQELLNLSQRDNPATSNSRPFYGKISGLSKRRDEELNLREDLTATYAECYIDTPPINVPPAEKFKLISTDVGGGTIPFSYSIELCWAFHYWGAKIGPLSEPLIIKTGPDVGINGIPSVYTATLQFTSFDDKAIAAQAFNAVVDRTPNKYEGLRKIVFFNQNFNPATGVRLGLPCWRAVSVGGATSSEGVTALAGQSILVSDETSTLTLTYLNQFNAGNARYVEWDGSIPRIRPYPRIIGSDFHNAKLVGNEETTPSADEEYFRRLEMRYTKKPLRMVTSTDSPQMPYEFHQLIVYAVLEDIYNKSNNLELALSYRKRIDTAMKGLEKRYIDSIDTVFVRQGFTSGMGQGMVYDSTSLRKTP